MALIGEAAAGRDDFQRQVLAGKQAFCMLDSPLDHIGMWRAVEFSLEFPDLLEET